MRSINPFQLMNLSQLFQPQATFQSRIAGLISIHEMNRFHPKDKYLKPNQPAKPKKLNRLNKPKKRERPEKQD